MRCSKCEHFNRVTARLCENCQKVMPPQAPEDTTFPYPTRHYETEQMLVIEEFVDLLLDGEDAFDELEEHLSVMGTNYRTFEERYNAESQALASLASGPSPDDEYLKKLSRVLKRGFEVFRKGQSAFAHFFQTESDDPEELENAFKLIREGNNYICLGLDLIHQRHDELQEVLD